MPVDTFNRPSDQPHTQEVLRAAQTIPADRLNPTQQIVNEQFEYMTAQPGLHEVGLQNATTEAQDAAQPADAFRMPGKFESQESVDDEFAGIVGQSEMQSLDVQADVQAAVDGYRIPIGTAAQTSEAIVPASAEVRRYGALEAKQEALNAADAIERIRGETLALARMNQGS